MSAFAGEEPMRRLVKTFALAVAIVGLSLVPEASVAAGAPPPKDTTTVMIKPQVQIAAPAGYSGANVTIRYSCLPGAYGGDPRERNFGSVRLGDAVGHQGSRFFFPVCDDRNETSVVFVQGSFVAGGGAANATVCGFDCGFASREVRIR